MQTVKGLNRQIESVSDEIKQSEKSADPKYKRAAKRLRRKVSYLRICLKYIETNPTVEFMKKEQDRICNRINKFIDLYDINQHGNKKGYEKEMGIPKLRKQLSLINFLLKKS